MTSSLSHADISYDTHHISSCTHFISSMDYVSIMSSHFVSSNLISSISHLLSSPIISYYLIASHVISCHVIVCHVISSHVIISLAVPETVDQTAILIPIDTFYPIKHDIQPPIPPPMEEIMLNPSSEIPTTNYTNT